MSNYKSDVLFVQTDNRYTIVWGLHRELGCPVCGWEKSLQIDGPGNYVRCKHCTGKFMRTNGHIFELVRDERGGGSK